MQAFAAGAPARGAGCRTLRSSRSGAERLEFLGETNLKNKRCRQATDAHGRAITRRYASFGDDLDVDDLLPGVTVEVLGPPTLEQQPVDRRPGPMTHEELLACGGRLGRGRSRQSDRR